MEQLTIYDELGLEDDPLFIKISEIKDKSHVEIENFKIIKNAFGLYEVISDDLHECASDIMNCYKVIRGKQHEAFSW